MPQMAPLKWFILYLFFFSIFMLFCVMNYYSFIPSSPHSKKLKKPMTPSYNWKW